MANNSEQELRDAANKIEARAKEHALKEALEAQQVMRGKLQEQRMARDLDALAALKEKGFTTDERGNKITLWQDALHAAEKAINAEQNAYNDWRSAMMALLSMYAKMVKAISHRFEEARRPYTDKIVQTIREGVLYPLKDKIMDKIKGDPDIKLDTLVHDIKMSEDNKLMIGDIKCDGAQPDPGFKPAVATLVGIWLRDQGYELAPDDTYVTADDNKTVLTAEKFKELKEDETNGLDAFIKANTKLESRPTLD